MENQLHLISFQSPYPANYGGIIDVYYKLKALKEAGIRVTLHTYLYDRSESKELEELAFRVYYYERKRGLGSFLSRLPYIVESRRSPELLQNLLLDEAPILFEGLHTCYWLDHPLLKVRQKWVRVHNVEHNYYAALAKATRNPLKWLYYRVESHRLRRYESTLQSAQLILPVAEGEAAYFARRFPNVEVELISCFHDTSWSDREKGRGDWILYHGNLAVSENSFAAEWIVKQLLPGMALRLVVAGANPPNSLVKLIAECERVELVANPSDEVLNRLIEGAKANLLLTFQPTGAKLKLLNALHKGGFCLVNSEMVEGTSLGAFCSVGDGVEELTGLLNEITLREWGKGDEQQRRSGMELMQKQNGVAPLLERLRL